MLYHHQCYSVCLYRLSGLFGNSEKQHRRSYRVSGSLFARNYFIHSFHFHEYIAKERRLMEVLKKMIIQTGVTLTSKIDISVPKKCVFTNGQQPENKIQLF